MASGVCVRVCAHVCVCVCRGGPVKRSRWKQAAGWLWPTSRSLSLPVLEDPTSLRSFYLWCLIRGSHCYDKEQLPRRPGQPLLAQASHQDAPTPPSPARRPEGCLTSETRGQKSKRFSSEVLLPDAAASRDSLILMAQTQTCPPFRYKAAFSPNPVQLG